ncbi:MAG: glycosyltransferase [Desulfobulbaceae bacterium]|nr:glycosyltransferase [Desulfobulbaceae bacterium]
MANQISKHLIIVLGMHRSGTSTITRGLQVLGVALGERLIAPKPDNPKGFWEDRDVVALNIEILEALGHSWHSLAPILPEEFAGPIIGELKTRAEELLRHRLSTCACYAFKDPRLPRLLPFWQEVFAQLPARVSYVVAYRNPLSVAKSLAARDGFDREKGYYLWLEQMLASLRHTLGQPVVVVDYDRLLAEPATQLQRIATTLDLRFDQGSQEFAEYRDLFLEDSLRHSSFSLADLAAEPSLPTPAVALLSKTLTELASDRCRASDPEVVRTIHGIAAQRQGSYAALRYLRACDEKIAALTANLQAHEGQKNHLQQLLADHQNQIGSLTQNLAALDGQISHLGQTIAEREGQIANLGQAVVERDSQIASLGLAVAERDDQITSLGQVVAARDGQIASLGLAVAERDGQIASLSQAVAERDGQIASLGLAVAERDGQIGSLSQAMAERDGQINNLGRAVAERDGRIASLNYLTSARDQEIAQIHRSTSWRLTRPLRSLKQGAGLLWGHLSWRVMRDNCRAVRGEVRRHGVSGFSRRLPYYLRHYRSHAALLALRSPAGEEGQFCAPTPVPIDVRLHPDLLGVSASHAASISIVIPTLNAGPEFPWLLRKLQAQRGLRKLDIVIVDSGSSDSTVAIARAAGCQVIEIPAADFSHSYARNTGAAAAGSDYLLFMVQDAYPIGDYWAYSLLRYLLDHAEDKLVAVSCAEYSRSDSDMMYDSMINTHYRFLGCLNHDRMGELRGDDHLALRACGQLSDVSCLIARETFARYRYRGDYAEDLDLGIRLIKDKYRVAMLASVKVVHSHNRPAAYYLKRSFVDVVFLAGMFADFPRQPMASVPGIMLGIVSTAAHLSAWLDSDRERGSSERVLQEELDDWIKGWRRNFAGLRLEQPSRVGDAQLDAYIDSLAERYLAPSPAEPDQSARAEARHFLESFLARLEHFNTFAGEVYGAQDAGLRRELREVVRKTFAATVGSTLGFLYMNFAASEGGEGEIAAALYRELKAGV